MSLTVGAGIPPLWRARRAPEKTGGSPPTSLLITARKEVDIELGPSPRQALSVRDGVVMTGAKARGALNHIWRPAIRNYVAFCC
jgi:hypothetical protein